MIPEILQRIALAFAIGLLVGIERGWQEREAQPGSRVAGIRTFALIGLLGGFCGLLLEPAGGLFLGLATFGFATGLAVFEWKRAEETGSVSATSFVAGLLVFCLSAYAVLGDQIAAAASAVLATVVLSQRILLHRLLKKVEWIDLRIALLLLVMTVILLPLLPDRSLDPWDAINPHKLWLMVILITAMSYSGYIAIKIAGGANGLLFAGLAGGLVSSTTVTWTFAQLARDVKGPRTDFAAGILASWAISLLRMSGVAIVIAPLLSVDLARLIGPLVVVIVVAAFFFYRKANQKEQNAQLQIKNPFDIQSILKFGVLLVAILVTTKWLISHFGAGSVFPLAALSGLADVDPITLSMAEAAGNSVDYSEAALVILTAAVANLVAKCSLAVAFGGIRFAAPLLAAALLGIVAAVPSIMLALL